MYRIFSVLIAVCLVTEASAETHQSGQRPELQVGGPMRILVTRNQASPISSGSSLEQPTEPKQPATGIILSLSQMLNADSEAASDQDPVESRNSSMTYSVTRSLSLGVGYHFVDAEDLVGKIAVVGAMDADHQSHHVLVRARWQFE